MQIIDLAFSFLTVLVVVVAADDGQICTGRSLENERDDMSKLAWQNENYPERLTHDCGYLVPTVNNFIFVLQSCNLPLSKFSTTFYRKLIKIVP